LILKAAVLLSLLLGGASLGDLRAAESAVTALPPSFQAHRLSLPT
jgi:hypothetical protein